ncbi:MULTISPECIES: TetR/AcrR family transcriptional regulator [unclassified Gordonia (in: high G+C Gram-positive bacteria)]
MADAAPATKENAERRIGILSAAAGLICERGFGDTRIADVAKRAEVSSALVIYYFGTRDQLLVEALRHYEEEFYTGASAMMRESPRFVDRLDKLIRSCCTPRGKDPSPGDWGLWLDVWATATRHPEVSDVRVEQDRRWRELVETVLREAVSHGEIEVADPRDLAVSLCVLLDGLAIQCTLGDSEVTPDRGYEIAMSYVESALGVALVRPDRVES